MRNYRARRVDNNELVYGGGFEHKGKAYIIPVDIRILPLGYTLGPPSLDGFIEVHPSTVSQSTGRKDVNDTEIYGDDRVAFTVFDYNDNDTQYKGTVKFHEGGWEIWNDEDESGYYEHEGAFELYWVCKQDSDIEIIPEGEKQ